MLVAIAFGYGCERPGSALLRRGAQHAVAEAAATKQAVLRVGFQTSIGRGLIPGVTAAMEEMLPGWKLMFRQVSWADPTIGLEGGDADVAIAWLPLPPGGGFTWKVLAAEDRWDLYALAPVTGRVGRRTPVVH
jgi:DNA-binding transcriptional LysR family regulator